MLWVPRFPAWPAVPAMLVAPFLAVAPWPAPFHAAWLLTDVRAVPGTAAPPAPAWSCATVPAASAGAESPCAELPDAPLAELAELAAGTSWPWLTKPFTPCAAREQVYVCA